MSNIPLFSVILRPNNPSGLQRRSDPVARYQQFRQSWSQQRAPGEKNHKNLRWNIREQMLSQDEVLEKVGFQIDLVENVYLDNIVKQVYDCYYKSQFIY